MIRNNISYSKIIFLFLLLIIPWLNADYFDDIYAEAPRQEDMSFYEVNPCKVSLLEFIKEVPIAAYQDHFHFRYNNYSSISCFGKISGATLLNNEFYISVGTNSFVNITLQTFFWLTLFSFLKKDRESDITKIKSVPLLLSVCLVMFLVISESRFYEQQLYYFDFTNIGYLYFLAISILIILLHSLRVILPRLSSLVNISPYIFVVSGVYSGFNLSFYLFFLVYIGIYSIIYKSSKNSIVYLTAITPFIYIWANISDKRYSFKVDKLRGFTSSSFDINSNLAWSAVFLLFLTGLFFIYKNYINDFHFEKIYRSLCNSSIVLLILGVIGANFPLVNFINYFYFGQQKYGVTINNPFSSDVYDQKLAWRGVFSSSEVAGEIFALFLVFTLYIYISEYIFKNIYYVGVFASVLGLYFSNNRAAFILLIFIAFYVLYSERSYLITKKYLFWCLLITFIMVLIYIIGFNNFTYSLNFIQNYTISKASEFQINGNTSSFYSLLTQSYNNSIKPFSLFGVVSIFSFFANRAIMWGLFIVRYNPSFSETLFGTGPLSFGKYFGEIQVDGINSLLLPHSSLLSYVIFIGLIGIAIIGAVFSFAIFKNKQNLSSYGYLLILYILLNVTKSDSLLYLQIIIFYSSVLFMFIKIENFRLLNIQVSKQSVK
jgi:hypothetical protein